MSLLNSQLPGLWAEPHVRRPMEFLKAVPYQWEEEQLQDDVGVDGQISGSCWAGSEARQTVSFSLSQFSPLCSLSVFLPILPSLIIIFPTLSTYCFACYLLGFRSPPFDIEVLSNTGCHLLFGQLCLWYLSSALAHFWLGTHSLPSGGCTNAESGTHSELLSYPNLYNINISHGGLKSPLWLES